MFILTFLFVLEYISRSVPEIMEEIFSWDMHNPVCPVWNDGDVHMVACSIPLCDSMCAQSRFISYILHLKCFSMIFTSL